MSDYDALDERLCAVERALTDDESDLTDLQDAAELTRELESLATRLDDVEDRLDELDAATQALRGYVGNVRAVNESVERRADAALAKAEALESEVIDAGDGTAELVEADERATDDRETDGRVTDERTTAERATAERPIDERATDRRATRSTATGSHATAPCGCRLRRSAVETDAAEDDTSSESDRGLLARLAEAL